MSILEYNPPPSSMDLLYGSSLHARHHRRGGMPIIQPIHNCQRHAPLQGSSKDKTPGSNNFVPSLACHVCLAWPGLQIPFNPEPFLLATLYSSQCHVICPPPPGSKLSQPQGKNGSMIDAGLHARARARGVGPHKELGKKHNFRAQCYATQSPKVAAFQGDTSQL